MYQRTKVKKPSMFAKQQASNTELQERAKSQEEIEEEQQHNYVPLFQKYPKLMSIPKVRLIKEPSRIRLMPNFAMKTGFKEIYIKRDDLLNDTYGGNKLRKFEFLLGYAEQQKVKVIHGIGNIGSNCCICLAAHARKFGIKPKLSLSEQPLTKEVQENLKLMGHFGARMSLVKEEQIWELHEQSIAQDPCAVLKDTQELLIPVGASNVIGTLGYVNAAFEVKKQIDCNDAKVPNLVFVPCSSLGTVAGLILGFALLDFKETKVYGVEISKQVQDKRKKIVQLAMDTYKYMKGFDSQLPEIDEQMLNDKLVLVSNFFGKGYGIPTKEGEAAKQMMKELDFIDLDTTYTGKTFAVIQYILEKKREMFEDKVVLFWNTKSSVNLSEELEDFHWEDDLPDEFHKYFNGDVEIVKESVDSLQGDDEIKFE